MSEWTGDNLRREKPNITPLSRSCCIVEPSKTRFMMVHDGPLDVRVCKLDAGYYCENSKICKEFQQIFVSNESDVM